MPRLHAEEKNIEREFFLSQLTLFSHQPGWHLHWGQPTGVEGGGDRQASSTKICIASFNGWQSYLCGRWFWWQLPFLNLELGPFYWILATCWWPKSGERLPCSCRNPIFHCRIRVFSNAFEMNSINSQSSDNQRRCLLSTFYLRLQLREYSSSSGLNCSIWGLNVTATEGAF